MQGLGPALLQWAETVEMPVDAVETGARGGVGSGKEPRGSGFKLAGRDPFV